MRSYYETETEVSETRIKSDTRDEKDQSMAEFLDNLPINYEGGLTEGEIQARVDGERQSWND